MIASISDKDISYIIGAIPASDIYLVITNSFLVISFPERSDISNSSLIVIILAIYLQSS